MNVGKLISGSSTFLKPSFKPVLDFQAQSGSSWFVKRWSLACKILSMTLLAWEMSAIVRWLAHSLVLLFLGIGPEYPNFKIKRLCFLFRDHKREQFNSWLKRPVLISGDNVKIVSQLGKAAVTHRSSHCYWQRHTCMDLFQVSIIWSAFCFCLWQLIFPDPCLSFLPFVENEESCFIIHYSFA